MKCELVQVIYTLENRGSGKDQTDPIRNVTQLWTVDGRLIAEFDPITDQSGGASPCSLNRVAA